MNLKVLLLLIAGHFVTDINTGALPAFLPFLKESLNLTYTMTASVILVFNVTSSVIQPIFGYLSDRWSIRWLLPLGPFIASLGLGLLGIAPSYFWVLLFVAFSGAGGASYHPEGFKTMNFLGGKKKATAISFFHFGGNLGFAAGPILATFLYTHFGLRGSLGLALPGIVILVVFLTAKYWEVKMIPREIGAAPSSASGQSRQIFFPMALLLSTVVLRSATRLSVLTFIPFYFIKILNHDPLVVGKYLSLFLLCGTAGVVAGGPIADRFGYKRTVLLSLALTSVCLGLFFLTSGWISLVLFSLAGLFSISSNAVTMAMGQSFMPRNVGMASGLVMGLAMGIGGIITTALGVVADRFGILSTLHFSCLLPVLAFLAFLSIPYPPPDPSAPSNPSP
jgi:FSR family fosmidomycin resistance protein-like MFS transporter